MNIKQKTQLLADLAKFNKKQNCEYTIESFTNDVKRYIKAVSDNRMMCLIDSVSSSGMSRTLRFFELSKSGYIYNFYTLFKFLGYQTTKDSDYFRVYGCGMDMVFNTNYTNIIAFVRYGLISKKRAAVLCQRTPHKV